MSSSRPYSPARDAALIAVFAGFVAALAVVPAYQPPGFAAPITAQTLGVMLAGAVLGARRGFAAVALLLVLVAVGLPLLAAGRGGLGVFFTPPMGFLLAWPLGAFVVGWITERFGAPYRLHWGLLANIVGGILVIYIGGILGFATVGGLSPWAATVSTWIYIPGDLVKVGLAALIAQGVHAAYPGLISARRERTEEPAAV